MQFFPKSIQLIKDFSFSFIQSLPSHMDHRLMDKKTQLIVPEKAHHDVLV